MKEVIRKYRSSLLILGVFVFTIIESLYFGIGTPMGFNLKPASIGEFICDSMCAAVFMFAILMGAYDWVDYLKKALHIK